MTTHAISLEALAAHQEWIRRLAGRLVSTADAAEDLVQDTWLIALQHPARIQSPEARGWLSTVIRNLARDRWRKDQRRAAREQQAARGEASADDATTALEEFESARALMDRVLALPEAERDLLIELYFKRRSSREIGAALGLSPAAVRNRHAAALQLLRRRLDADNGGDRGRWTHALAALAVPTESTRPARWLLGVVAAGLVSSGAWMALRPPAAETRTEGTPGPVALEAPGRIESVGGPELAPPARLESTPPAREVGLAAVTVEGADQEPSPPERQPRSARGVRRVTGLVTPMPEGTVSGHFVVDPDAALGSGFTRPAQRLGLVGKGGSFRFSIPEGRAGRLVVLADGYAPAWVDLAAKGERENLELLLTQGAEISGRVPLEAGLPDGMRVSYRALDAGRPIEGLGLAWTQDGLRRMEGTARIAADGRFRITGLAEGRHGLRAQPAPSLGSAHYEHAAAWNGGRALEPRLFTSLDFCTSPGQIVACPAQDVELLERARNLNVFVIADGALLKDCWIMREGRPNHRFGSHGVVTCRYDDGASFALLIEREGFMPRRIQPLQHIDPVLDCAVVEMERSAASKRAWIEIVGNGPANVRVTCQVESPSVPLGPGPRSRPAGGGRIEVVDSTSGAGLVRVTEAATSPLEPRWFVDWTMPASELVDGAVIPVHMVLGGRVRVRTSGGPPAPGWNLEARIEGGEWRTLGAYRREPSGVRDYVDPLEPGRYELRMRSLDGSEGRSVSFEIEAREVTEVVLPH